MYSLNTYMDETEMKFFTALLRDACERDNIVRKELYNSQEMIKNMKDDYNIKSKSDSSLYGYLSNISNIQNHTHPSSIYESSMFILLENYIKSYNQWLRFNGLKVKIVGNRIAIYSKNIKDEEDEYIICKEISLRDNSNTIKFDPLKIIDGKKFLKRSIDVNNNIVYCVYDIEFITEKIMNDDGSIYPKEFNYFKHLDFVYLINEISHIILQTFDNSNEDKWKLNLNHNLREEEIKEYEKIYNQLSEFKSTITIWKEYNRNNRFYCIELDNLGTYKGIIPHKFYIREHNSFRECLILDTIFSLIENRYYVSDTSWFSFKYDNRIILHKDHIEYKKSIYGISKLYPDTYKRGYIDISYIPLSEWEFLINSIRTKIEDCYRKYFS